MPYKFNIEAKNLPLEGISEASVILISPPLRFDLDPLTGFVNIYQGSSLPHFALDNSKVILIIDRQATLISRTETNS